MTSDVRLNCEFDLNTPTEFIVLSNINQWITSPEFFIGKMPVNCQKHLPKFPWVSGD